MAMDFDYYTDSHFEIERIANEVAADVSPPFDHLDIGPPPSYDHDFHEDVAAAEHDESSGEDTDGDLVKDKWEHRHGDVVEGGYTVHEPDGTVHHIRYTENKRRGRGEEDGGDGS